MARPQPLPAGHPTGRILGNAPAMADLRAKIRQLAPFDRLSSTLVPTVLLQGEKGTGKGLVAHGDRARVARMLAELAALPRVRADLAGAMTAGQHALVLVTALGDVALQLEASWPLALAYHDSGDDGTAADRSGKLASSVHRAREQRCQA